MAQGTPGLVYGARGARRRPRAASRVHAGPLEEAVFEVVQIWEQEFKAKPPIRVLTAARAGVVMGQPPILDPFSSDDWHTYPTGTQNWTEYVDNDN